MKKDLENERDARWRTKGGKHWLKKLTKTRKKVCPECGGAGYLGDSICEHCNGEGVV